MCKKSCAVCYPPKPKAKMPWDGPIHLTKLSNGRAVLRGSREEAEHKFGACIA